ncbi:MAG: hydantoinase B/oxoprolinase family protein [bacterium]|nr:hydantoinase B/oxoprolinase family protein [bacterium]
MVDSITSEVIRHSMLSATQEMARNLCRTAYNTVVYEIHDYGIGLHDPAGNTIAEAPGIAIFSGANDFGIQKTIEEMGTGDMFPGDVFMLNYPYWSAAHTLDVLVFCPIFAGEDRLIGFASCRVHLLDLKQRDVGYVLDSTDMSQEGIFFPSVKLYERGTIRNDIFNIIRFNSRFPERTIGDLQAEVSAVHTGDVRLREIIEKYGADVVLAAMEDISDHGERLSRAAVAKLPDGTWSAVDYVDSDGVNLDELIEMKVTVTIEGDRMIIDWTETDKPAVGPINVPVGLTIAASRLAFKSLTTPDSFICAGNFRNLEVRTSPGSLMHALPPMPTFTLWTGLLAPEVIMKALAQGLPDVVPACSGGDVCDVMALGVNPRTGAAWLEATNDAIGFGAHADGDGADGIMHVTEPGCRNNPIEVLENKGPLLIEEYGFRADSGGAGKNRGGVGVVRAYRFLAPTDAIVINYKTKTQPWSVAGGTKGVKNTVLVEPGTTAEREVGCSHNIFDTNGTITNLTGGGGGWGNPFEREVDRVVQDVKQGFVSPESARSDYGVVVDGITLEIDDAATLQLRVAAAAK